MKPAVRFASCLLGPALIIQVAAGCVARDLPARPPGPSDEGTGTLDGGTDMRRLDPGPGGQPAYPVQLAAGARHTCALLSDGRVACWGAGDRGQLGDGTLDDRAEPSIVPGLIDVEQIAAGDEHTCAVLTLDENRRILDDPGPLPRSGPAFDRLRCWGANDQGQLGDATTEDRPVPTLIPPPRRPSAFGGTRFVVLGGHQSCSHDIEGTLACWGGLWGPRPSDILAGLGVDFGVGLDHICFEYGTGVYCDGQDDQGQLGHEPAPDSDQRYVPGLEAAQELALGGNRSCVLLLDGSVQCFGEAVLGPDAAGQVTSVRTPMAILGLESRVRRLSVAAAHACALDVDGVVRCWGRNDRGQLGTGDGVPRATPGDALGAFDEKGAAGPVLQVVAGGAHTCVLEGSGRVLCSGANDRGQLGDGTRDDRPAAVVALGLAIDGGSAPPDPPPLAACAPPPGTSRPQTLVTLDYSSGGGCSGSECVDFLHLEASCELEVQRRNLPRSTRASEGDCQRVKEWVTSDVVLDVLASPVCSRGSGNPDLSFQIGLVDREPISRPVYVGCGDPTLAALQGCLDAFVDRYAAARP